MEKTFISDNGISIYHYANPDLHSFCLCLYVKAGSMYETKKTNGISHLWEHMIFRKLSQIYQGEFFYQVDQLGLDFSATTYKEFIQFQIDGPCERFEDAAKIIAHVFDPFQLSVKELNMEKRRVYAEMRERGRKFSIEYCAGRKIWKGTSLSRTILGKYKVIRQTKEKDLQKFQNEILSADNIFFYLTGNFTMENLSFLNRSVSSYSFSSRLHRDNMAPVPKDFFHRNGKIQLIDSYCNEVYFSLDIDMSKYTMAELDLLYNILFCGTSCKMYQYLSEKKGYIYTFDSYFDCYNNMGNLGFSYEVLEKDLLHSLKIVIEILNNLKLNITEELSYVIPTYTIRLLSDLDDAESLNLNMASECHIRTGTYHSIEEQAQLYAVITPERMLEVAKELFKLENLHVTVNTTKENFDKKKALKILRKLKECVAK